MAAALIAEQPNLTLEEVGFDRFDHALPQVISSARSQSVRPPPAATHRGSAPGTLPTRRAIDRPRVAREYWKTITFVAGLRHDGMVAPLVIDGAIDGATFVAYIEQCLAPTLARGDIVIMDNLSAHKVSGVEEEAIEEVGAKVFYLSSAQYSPDLNPIEQVFSKLKALLRKAAERTIRHLCRRIAAFLAESALKNAATFSMPDMHPHERNPL
jgi:transposase